MVKARRDTHLPKLEKEKNDPKQTWNIFKNIVPHKQPKKSSSYESPDERAQIFKDFFSNVGKHTYDEVMRERSKIHSDINETLEINEPTCHTLPSFTNLPPEQETWSSKPASGAEIVPVLLARWHSAAWAD